MVLLCRVNKTESYWSCFFFNTHGSWNMPAQDNLYFLIIMTKTISVVCVHKARFSIFFCLSMLQSSMELGNDFGYKRVSKRWAMDRKCFLKSCVSVLVVTLIIVSFILWFSKRISITQYHTNAVLDLCLCFIFWGYWYCMITCHIGTSSHGCSL